MRKMRLLCWRIFPTAGASIYLNHLKSANFVHGDGHVSTRNEGELNALISTNNVVNSEGNLFFLRK